MAAITTAGIYPGTSNVMAGHLVSLARRVRRLGPHRPPRETPAARQTCTVMLSRRHQDEHRVAWAEISRTASALVLCPGQDLPTLMLICDLINAGLLGVTVAAH